MVTRSDPVRRVVLLGASNVRRGFSPLVAAARALAGGPVTVYAAMGHGRSYGNWSSIPGRALPGIVDCGLWGAVAPPTKLPGMALVTDIGNDLLYGVSPDRIASWVAECVERLLAGNARVVVTELPVGNLEHLGEWRYRFFRTLFFARCRYSLAELAGLAREVNDAVKRLARTPGVSVVPLANEWYGFDPIHIKPPLFSIVWKKILSHALHSEAHRLAVNATDRLPISTRAALSFAPPAERRLLGLQQRRSQPRVTLGDGSSVSLY